MNSGPEYVATQNVTKVLVEVALLKGALDSVSNVSAFNHLLGTAFRAWADSMRVYYGNSDKITFWSVDREMQVIDQPLQINEHLKEFQTPILTPCEILDLHAFEETYGTAQPT